MGDFAVPAALADLQLLQSICTQVRFEPGDVLRQKGQHYRDMYVITDGCVDVDPGPAGSPIGEIAFLRGSPATATVTARTATAALVIGDPTLARLEREQPA